MKISCQSCQAKYTIADEKVVGKIVKIRCKKCGATIVINGNDPDTAAQAGGGGGGDYAGGGEEQWTVNVAEGDQRTMSLGEIIQEYKTGVVSDDTYCWKDGMNDWLPLREIEQLYSACTSGVAPAADFAPMMSVGPAIPANDEPTNASGGFGLFGGGGSNGETTQASNGALFGSGSSPPPAVGPGAARRQTGRGGGDLFGGVAQAGSEQDVLSSASAGGGGGGGGMAGGGDTAGSKMTGARNENSVLFSLSALTNEPNAPPAPKSEGQMGDGSGLIDIRALASSMGVEGNKPAGNAKVDDIMNLSGGGAFSAALAAPVLAPPTADMSSMSMGGAPEEKKSNKMLIGLVAGGGLLGICVLGAALILSGGKDKDKDGTENAKPTTSAEATPQPSAAAAPAETAKPVESVAANPPGTPTPPGQNAGSSKSGSSGTKPSAGGDKPHAAEATPPPAADPTPAPAAKPKSLAEEMARAGGGDTKPAPKAEPAGGTAPFDRGAALAALNGVNVQSCKKPDGPTGPGKVKVTFEPNGSVSKVEFAEGSFAGTPVGGCILGKFRGAHIPAFGGPAVTAGKSFTLN